MVPTGGPKGAGRPNSGRILLPYVTSPHRSSVPLPCIGDASDWRSVRQLQPFDSVGKTPHLAITRFVAETHICHCCARIEKLHRKNDSFGLLPTRRARDPRPRAGGGGGLPRNPGRRGWWSSCRRRRDGRRRARSRWRRSGRRCVRRLRPSGHRDLVALGVHALHVGDVVAALHRRVRALGGTRAHSRPAEQPGSRANGCTHRLSRSYRWSTFHTLKK